MKLVLTFLLTLAVGRWVRSFAVDLVRLFAWDGEEVHG